MFLRIAVCTALLSAASVASAQARPPVGTVFFKDATDCFDMNDEQNFPMCVMASNGGAFDANLPYRPVTSMTLPFGRYVLTAKVLNYLGGDRPQNPWVVVECQLEDRNHNVIDYSSDNYGSDVRGSAGLSAQNGGTPLVLSGVLDVRSSAGTTVTLACRVQGQSVGQNAEDGTLYWGAPVQNVRFHNAQIMAVSAAQIIKR